MSEQRRKCKQCDQWKDETGLIGRKSGGNYKRGHTSKRTAICIDCAVALLRSRTAGALTIQRWNIVDLQHFVRRLVGG